MPSLKDLAKECGVSVATVSKALNDQPDISPATRERVRAAAHRMGYLPNAAARSLKTNRTYNLGVLFVDERQSGLTHEYFSAVLDSFKVEAEKHGYDITFINHNISGKSMSYLEHCRYRNVDGVVIACVNFYEPQVVELVNSEVPVVTIDHVFNNRMAILSDNVFGLKALVRQAWACGHRRIAFIHGEKTAVTENRVAGFYQACEELGLKIPEAYVREGIYHDADRCAAETKAHLPGRFLRAGRLQRHQRSGPFDPRGHLGDGLRRHLPFPGGQASAGDLPAEHRRAGPHGCRQAH